MSSTDALSCDNRISAGEAFLPHLKSGTTSLLRRNNTGIPGKNRHKCESVNLSYHRCFDKRLKIAPHLCV